MKKGIFNKTLLSSLMIASVFTMNGCGSNADDANKVDAKKLTQDIAKKYAKEETVAYKEKKANVKRDESFDFEVSAEAKEIFKGITTQWTDIIGVYRDSNLTQEVSIKATQSDTGVTYSPYRKPVFALADEERGGILYDQGEWNDWGNAQQYYIVQKYNLQTGEKLEKPEVTLFTIGTEIKDTPQVSFYVNENGVGGLKWNKIKGATEYAIVQVDEGKDGKASKRYVKTIATVKENKWEDTSSNTEDINKNFRTTYGKSLDTYFEEQKKINENVNAEDIAKTQFDGESDFDKEYNKYFAVIALNDKGTSKISNMLDKRMLANQVPIQVASYMNEGGIKPSGKNSKVTVDRDIMMTSTHVWVVMANGNVTQKLVLYDTAKVKEDVAHYYTYEEDENGDVKKDENGNPVNFSSEDVPCLSIPFTIEGTSYKGYAQVLQYDKENYKKQLKELKARQENLRDRTGDIEKDVRLNDSTEEEEEKAETLYNDYTIYASNGLSEYLALQMLNGQIRVNLDEFKEAMDQEYLLDAWYEAIYQNPLTLGVRGISYDAKNNDVLISYDQDSKTQRTKQQEIVTKVKEVNKSIIKEGMSDLEKETAINDYLCANAEYDDAALENAEKNNFKKVDEEFNDSFTAYGILINGKGVCAGYAGAFKLLADDAGLKNVVVTGYLQGSLPHAWNRVSLDEEWYTLDTTNNDNEYYKNGLFNLSDYEAATVLKEDTLYVMDSDLANFKASTDKNEFYRVNGKYFAQSDVASKLAQDITANGSATYRTDVSLTEDQFYEIAKEVIQLTGTADLQGGYFLGVIYISK
ncbi:transglutaminase domain-containing protein [Amedibacillus sp. YH-ame10]